MARKKEERDNGKYKRLANKSKKQHEGKEDADIIRSQLLPLGLQLREVPGDGNCLFRALGDQLDGHMGNHYRHRQDTTNYMMENRSDFQPFVEDDQPFEKHINLLSQLGTYAGNDAIVAFARLHQVAIVIHQPNTPLWQIKGWETDTVSKKETTKKGKGDKSSPLNKLGRQLHIAYHGGDHYDSVRRLGDSGHLPANILMDIESSTHEVSYGQPYESSNQAEEAFEGYEIHPENEFEKLEISDAEREAMQRSGCEDLDAVRQLLMNNCGNVDAAVDDLIELTSGGQEKVESTSSGRSRNQLSRKQLEKIRKQERKRASEARKKHSNGSSSNQVPEETVVIGKVQCLNI